MGSWVHEKVLSTCVQFPDPAACKGVVLWRMNVDDIVPTSVELPIEAVLQLSRAFVR